MILVMNAGEAELRGDGNAAFTRRRGTAAPDKKKAVNAFTALERS